MRTAAKTKRKRERAPFCLGPILAALEVTQRDLAGRIGAGEQWISALVLGKQSVHWDTAVRIADALNISLDALATGRLRRNYA